MTNEHENHEAPPSHEEDQEKTMLEEQELELEAKRQAARERAIKQLSQIVCICKGIKLARVLKGLEESQTVAEVNRKVGTGSGGCAGQRCGPRIKALLNKKKAQKEKEKK